MTHIITFMDFKKLLINKNIYLFDGQYRVVHALLNELNENTSYNQSGGAIINNNIINKVNKLNSVHLLHLVNAILDKNKVKLNWILALDN